MPEKLPPDLVRELAKKYIRFRDLRVAFADLNGRMEKMRVALDNAEHDYNDYVYQYMRREDFTVEEVLQSCAAVMAEQGEW